MTEPALHSVSVSAVVIDDQQRVLLIRRRDNGEWQPPGGILELDEDIYTGLRREVLEETGYVVEPERLTGVYKNVSLHVVALVFRCHIIRGDASTSDETTDVAWVPLVEVPKRMSEAFAIRVLDAAGDVREVAIRTHDGRELITFLRSR